MRVQYAVQDAAAGQKSCFRHTVQGIHFRLFLWGLLSLSSVRLTLKLLHLACRWNTVSPLLALLTVIYWVWMCLCLGFGDMTLQPIEFTFLLSTMLMRLCYDDHISPFSCDKNESLLLTCKSITEGCVMVLLDPPPNPQLFLYFIHLKRKCAHVAGLCRVPFCGGQPDCRGRAAAQLPRASQVWQRELAHSWTFWRIYHLQSSDSTSGCWLVGATLRV